MAAISVLLLWLYTFLVLSRNPNLGKDTLIFYKVGKKIVQLLLAYSPILIGFGTALSIAMPTNNDGEPHEMGFPIIAINTMVGLLMGEFELQDRFPGAPNLTTEWHHNGSTFRNGTTNSPYSKEFWTDFNYTAHGIFFLFVGMVSIVVSNILIAFALKVTLTQYNQ